MHWVMVCNQLVSNALLLELIKMSYHTRNVTEAMKVILDMCLVWPFEDPL